MSGAGLLRRAEEGFALLAIFLCTEAILPLARRVGGYEGDPIAGDPALQAVWIALYVITAVLCSFRWRTTLRVAFRGRAMVGLLGMVVLSVLWSDAPQVTLRRSSALLGTSLVGVLIGSRFSTSKQIDLVAVAFGVAAVLSVVFALALPMYGLESEIHEGAWRGVYVQKNVLGRVMVLEALACMLVFLRKPTRVWLPVAGMFLSTVVLVLSRSVTSMIMLAVLIGSVPLLRASRWRYTLAVPAIVTTAVLGGIVLAFATTHLDEMFGLIGRDATLTGRTELWPAVLKAIGERPLLGYGYGGFWLGTQGESRSVISDVGWGVQHAHNGYLDLCLDLGIVGLGLYLAGFLRCGMESFVRFRREGTVEALWRFLLLLFIFLYNFVESGILARNGIAWVLYVSLLISTCKPKNLDRRLAEAN